MSLPIYLKKDDAEKLLSAQVPRRHKWDQDGRWQRIDTRNRLMVRLMLMTGMRVGEIRNLHVENVDFDERMIYVRGGKGNKDRIIFCDPETLAKLKEFVGDQTGRIFPIQTHRIQRIVRKMARLAGVRNANLVTPHKLRHTFAINWVQKGGDIECLRRLMGHNSLETTQVYLNFDFAYVRGQYDRLFKRDFGTI